MPNPLTDELSPEAKAELAAQFEELKRWYLPLDLWLEHPTTRAMARGRRPWELK
jgi:hypothetical protein